MNNFTHICPKRFANFFRIFIEEVFFYSEFDVKEVSIKIVGDIAIIDVIMNEENEKQ